MEENSTAICSKYHNLLILILLFAQKLLETTVPRLSGWDILRELKRTDRYDAYKKARLQQQHEGGGKSFVEER